MLRPLFLLILCLAPACGSQTTTTVLAAPIELEEAMRIPLVSDRLPIVELTLNGVSGQKFLLDSGAGMSIIDLKQAQDLGFEIKPYSDSSSARGSGGNRVEYDSFVTAERLSMGDLVLQGGRLPAIESRVLSDLGILGVLGQDVLARLVVVVDMGASTLHVLPIGSEFEDIEDYLGRAEVGIGAWGLMPYDARPCPFVALEIPGVQGAAPELEIDTGAVTSSFPRSAIEALGLKATGTTMSQGLGGVFEEATYELEDFQLLKFFIDCEIKSSPLDFGLLGMDILGQFVFVLDGPGHGLWLFHREVESQRSETGD
ncbi:MAG: aspartyl protease family protein [Planctomycetota bacterium]|nr:aspartyl protease family protein [Planctomycetota bacterium]